MDTGDGDSLGDSLGADELLQFLEQFGDVPLADHDPAPTVIESGVAPELLRAYEEPMLSPEEREMLLTVLQNAASEGEGACDGELGGTIAVEEPDSYHGDSARTAGEFGTSGSEGSESAAALSGQRNASFDEGVEASGDLAALIAHRAQLQRPARRKQAPRPHRRRRKHDVDELRTQVKELTETLVRLGTQSQSHAVVKAILQQQQQQRADSQLLATQVPAELSEWRCVAVHEREKTRAAVLENTRLRALYESQLRVLQMLQKMRRGQFNFAPKHGFPTPASPLTKRPRLDPFDDDFAIFASLGHDFDAQYDDIDRILKAAGLLHFDGAVTPELRSKRDARGRFFMESIHARVIPQDMLIMDRAIAETNKSPQLHQSHKSFEIWHATDTMSFMKIVDVIRLPHAEATLTLRMALKKFAFAHRIVGVWDCVIEVSGCVSMRLSERGWNALRPPRVPPANHSGPLTIEQSCVRYFPIDSSVSSEQDIAEGTLNRMLIESYRRHLHLMHQITDEILTNDFEKLSLG